MNGYSFVCVYSFRACFVRTCRCTPPFPLSSLALSSRPYKTKRTWLQWHIQRLLVLTYSCPRGTTHFLAPPKRKPSLLFYATTFYEFGLNIFLGSPNAMPGIQIIRVALLLAIIFLFDKCSAYPSIRPRQALESLCKGCGESCHKCEFGVVMSSACGVLQCARGPDQPCGGPRGLLGTCGEGMHCSCNKCIGCSSEEFECSKVVPCLPHKTPESLLFSRFGKLPAIM